MEAPSELSFARLSRLQGRALGSAGLLGGSSVRAAWGWWAQREAFGFYPPPGVGQAEHSKWVLGALPLNVGWPSDLLLTSRI